MERTDVYLSKCEKCVYEREITVRQETRFTLYSKLTNFYFLLLDNQIYCAINFDRAYRILVILNFANLHARNL